jgi:DNA repair exonuclease SbcCD ATPase subunit
MMTDVNDTPGTDEITELFEQFRNLVLARLQEGDEALRKRAQEGQQFDRERGRLQSEISQLQQVVNEQGAALTAGKAIEKNKQLLEERCGALKEQCAGLKQELSHLQGELSQLQQVVNEQAATLAAAKAIDKDRQLLKEQCAALKQELQTLQARHGELTSQVEQERAQAAQQLVDWDAWEKGIARRLEKLQETNHELERRLLESERQVSEAARPQTPPAAAEPSVPVKTASDTEAVAQRRLESERRIAELVRRKLHAQTPAGNADPAPTAPDEQELSRRRGESEQPAAEAPRQKIASPSATPRPPGNAARDTRRIATPCRVVIHRSVNDEVQGWAVERSMEGLALLVDEKYTVGAPLKVRSGKSTQASWIDVVVDECCPERANFKLRCSFANPVTWADIQHLAG